jgi:hypothetical protein
MNRRGLIGVAVLVLVALSIRDGATEAPQALAGGTPCTGDCNRDLRVGTGELVLGVGVALGRQDLSSCAMIDANDSGAAEVDELVAAVVNSFNQCGSLGLPETGLNRLAAGDVQNASHFFTAALSAQPSDLVRLGAAVTGVVNTVLNDGRLRALARRSGVFLSGSAYDVCDLDLRFADEIPEGAPRTAEIVAAAREVLLPALREALDRIETIDGGAVLRFDPQDLPDCIDVGLDEVVEIDRGDLLVLRAGIETALAALDLAASYDLDVALEQLIEESAGDTLAAEPTLLTSVSAERLASARDLLGAALDHAAAAIDAVRAEGDDQDDDLILILPEDGEDADKARRLVERLRAALSGEARIPIDVATGAISLDDGAGEPHERLNLDPFFSGEFESLRPFLPELDEDGDFDPDRFPDPTFAGSAPDLTADDIDVFLERAQFGDADDFIDHSPFLD